MTAFTESVVEQAALAWLESLGWRVTHGLDIAPSEAGARLSTCEEAAHVRCGSGRCLSMGDYVTGLGATRGAPAAGGC